MSVLLFTARRLSCRKSVCPSVTLVDCTQMVRPTIMIFFTTRQISSTHSNGITFKFKVKYKCGRQNVVFSIKTACILFDSRQVHHSAFHPSAVRKSSTSLLVVVKAGRVITCVGWQVTLCDPIWQVTSRSSRTSSRRGLYSALTFNLTISETVNTPIS